MQTIAEKLQKIKNATAKIKDSIVEKGGTIDGDISTWYSAIDNIETGESDGDDVIFYDYDGSILYSYSANKFLSLTEMPELPVREGLICQEWNYDFDKAKAYVAKYGKCNIGATYITDDGKTRLYIKIAADSRMDVPLQFSQTVANGVTIDWGDGSATETLSGTGSRRSIHKYASVGDYCITLSVAEGCILGFGGSSQSSCVLNNATTTAVLAYRNMLQRVEIGSGVTSIGGYTFYGCYSLASIVIPKGVTVIKSKTFAGCSSMKFCDFSSLPAVPSLSATDAFNSNLWDCKIIVPDALYDEWIAATNWSTFAKYIIKKSDWDALQ